MNLAICEMCLKRNIVDCYILKKDNTKILRIRSSHDSRTIHYNCYLAVLSERAGEINFSELSQEFKKLRMCDDRCPYFFEHQLTDWNTENECRALQEMS